MKHDFIDKYNKLESPIHSLDPRVKIISSFIAIIIISSESISGKLVNLIIYLAIILILAALSKIPANYILKRMLIVAPFIFMAAIFYPLSLILSDNAALSDDLWFLTEAGLSIFLKAFNALLILVLLSSSEKFHNLLIALRKFKMPTIILTTSALLYRYIFIFEDELLRTYRARESRSPGKLKINILKVYGNQIAMIFLRSWERSQIIYKSMLSRGFDGSFHDMSENKLRTIDIVVSIIFIVILLLIKFLI